MEEIFQQTKWIRLQSKHNLRYFIYWLWLHVSDWISPSSGLSQRANSRKM